MDIYETNANNSTICHGNSNELSSTVTLPVDVSAIVVSLLSAMSVCRVSCVMCLPSLPALPTNSDTRQTDGPADRQWHNSVKFPFAAV